MVFSMDDEFPSVLHLAAVDDEGVVITNVPLHVLDTLLKLDVVMIPGDRACRQGNDTTSETSTLSLQCKCRLRLDDKSWGSALAVNQNLLHAIFLHTVHFFSFFHLTVNKIKIFFKSPVRVQIHKEVEHI